MSPVKDLLGTAVDGLADELEALSHRIHAHPELCYQEVQAAGWLADFLAARGFAVERGVAGVATAFRATLETGAGPSIAILCEYDALPEIGHACGHNVIAASGAGAGAALAAARDRLPHGRVQVIGTPAEEGGGGKIKLLRGGVFQDVDAAIMIHGWDRWVAHQDLLGVVRVGLEFTGKAAHASAEPWGGVNALDAVIQTFNAIGMLRQQVRPECRIHGIVTNGGVAPNIIPERAEALFYVRAPRLAELGELTRRVVACAEGAARATGSALRVVEHDNAYEPMRRVPTLVDLFRENMRRLGVSESPEAKEHLGSSDVGNVSQVVPTIQPYVKIAPDGTPWHSRAFEAAARSPLAREGLVAAAKTMAMTAFDLLADPGLVARAKKEFASLGIALVFALAGCAGMMQPATTDNTAAAELRNASGQPVGTASFTEVSGGVRIVLDVRGLAPGAKGVHIHETGKCDPPGFTTAGGHFNPDGKQHGALNPLGSHAGDLPNLTVGANGSGRMETMTTLVTLSPGPRSILGDPPRALVVHAAPDDFKTDPTGNSGARIACGVIVKAGAPPAAKPAGY